MLTPRHLSNAIDADRYEMYVILTAVLSTFRFDFFHGKVLGAAVKVVATLQHSGKLSIPRMNMLSSHTVVL